MNNPYRIEGPALISFSGGRTSAFMLRMILDAHGGKLPDNVVVAFANTGKEREETLRFVHECETRWGVKVHWLEHRPGDEKFAEVTYETASRDGEPFAAVIASKSFLPNAVTRYCTVLLKVRVIRDFAKMRLGWKNWNSVIGLRYDEGLRVMRALERNDAKKDPFRAVMPMAKAKHTRADVMEFWTRQPFDLGLMSYEGNCDLCFLKSRAKLQTIMRENPGAADWWIEQERAMARGRKKTARQFNPDHTYAALADAADRQGFLPFADTYEHDAECGLACAETD